MGRVRGPYRGYNRTVPEHARMRCPVDNCHYDHGRPAEGTVVGMKRHVRRVHGLLLYERVIWPPIYLHGTSKYAERLREDSKDPATMTLKELRSLARRRGLPIHGKNKPQLQNELAW